MNLQSMDLSSVIDEIPAPILIIDHAKIILYANKSTESLFGYSRKFLLGKTIEVILPEREHESFSHFYVQQLEHSTSSVLKNSLELFGLKKNKAEFPMELYYSALKQQTVALITIKELEHSHHAKEQFLATMHHQLRTPLNAVLGFSEILLLKLAGDLTPEQEKQIGIIHKSGKHLLALINALSDLQKINSGEMPYSIENLNANEIILNAMKTMHPLAEEKNLMFTSKLPKKIITIASDIHLLTQILTNIINNAIKFTDQGSVFVELAENTEHAFIHIIDTGVGIKEEKIDHVFQAFQQLYLAEKKNEGSGLGLYISKKLADLISVQLKVFSQYGKGTHFTIIIPRAKSS